MQGYHLYHHENKVVVLRAKASMNACINCDMGFTCAWYDDAEVYVKLFTGSLTTFVN